jgi:hypothetical protein
VAEARAKAREMLEGGAPALSQNFAEVVEQFLAHGRTRKGRELRQNSIRQYKHVFARYARPLHQRPLAEITRRDVAGVIRDVANESGATTASLVRAMLGRLWNFAIEVGEAEHNPVQHTPSYAVFARSRTLTDSEIAAIWAATEDRSSATWTSTRSAISPPRRSASSPSRPRSAPARTTRRPARCAPSSAPTVPSPTARRSA